VTGSFRRPRDRQHILQSCHKRGGGERLNGRNSCYGQTTYSRSCWAIRYFYDYSRSSCRVRFGSVRTRLCARRDPPHKTYPRTQKTQRRRANYEELGRLARHQCLRAAAQSPIRGYRKVARHRSRKCLRLAPPARLCRGHNARR